MTSVLASPIKVNFAKKILRMLPTDEISSLHLENLFQIVLPRFLEDGSNTVRKLHLRNSKGDSHFISVLPFQDGATSAEDITRISFYTHRRSIQRLINLQKLTDFFSIREAKKLTSKTQPTKTQVWEKITRNWRARLKQKLLNSKFRQGILWPLL